MIEGRKPSLLVRLVLKLADDGWLNWSQLAGASQSLDDIRTAGPIVMLQSLALANVEPALAGAPIFCAAQKLPAILTQRDTVGLNLGKAYQCSFTNWAASRALNGYGFCAAAINSRRIPPGIWHIM